MSAPAKTLIAREISQARTVLGRQPSAIYVGSEEYNELCADCAFDSLLVESQPPAISGIPVLVVLQRNHIGVAI